MRAGNRRLFLSSVAFATAIWGGMAAAQSLRNANPPAELPPASFSANQYVDSKGCVFIRAGIDGTVTWVPRVTRTREQLCGFQPSLGGGTVVAVANTQAPSTEPAPEATSEPDPEPASEPASEPVAVVTPEPVPAVQASTQAQAQTSQIQTPAQPVQAAQTPPASPSPQVIVTQASQETTQIAQPAPRVRLTRAQACADAEATGRRYVSALTGTTLDCGSVAPVQSATAQRTAVPQLRYTNPLDSAPGARYAPQRIVTVPTANRRAAPYSNPLDSAPGAIGFVSSERRPAPAAQQQTFWQKVTGQQPAPYSNPTRSFAATAPTPPSGYDRVWSDGRLNPNRGLPSAAPRTVTYAAQQIASPQTTRQVAPAPASPATATAAAAPRPAPEQISGHRYVQVGTYAGRADAQSIAQALRAAGLPMRIGVYTQQGREMRIVLAGPFDSDAQLQRALSTARGAGHTGAFTRQ